MIAAQSAPSAVCIKWGGTKIFQAIVWSKLVSNYLLDVSQFYLGISICLDFPTTLTHLSL